MNQEIKYSGFSAVPSDYECSDGSLAVSINLLPEDGALKPILSPSIKFNLPLYQSVVYIHKGNQFVNYIVKTADSKSTKISCRGSNESFLTLKKDETIVGIEALGNMLLVSTTLHLYYIYYKNEKYTLLGTELPKVDMRFSLASELVTAEHKTKLTFSDYTSSADTWQKYTQGSFDTDLAALTTDRLPTITRSPLVPITFTSSLKEGTEYKLQIKGQGYTQINLYGDDGKNKEILVISSKNNKFKVTKAYTKYYIEVISNSGYFTSYHASGTVTIYNGFENTVIGRVIEYNEANYTAVAAAINKFVAERAINKSKFIYPFFVRYALRLFDGSHARLSSPILMVPNSGYAPLVNFKDASNTLTLYAFIANLEYRFLNSIDENWRDIVAGVDVFVSQQVYPYNQGDNYNANENLFSYAVLNKDIDQISDTNYGYADLTKPGMSVQYGPGRHDIVTVAKTFFGFGDLEKQNDWRIIKLAPADDTLEKLQKTGLFYLVHSFDFDEVKITDEEILGDETIPLNLKKGVLSSLVNRQTLEDDMLSNCTFYNAHLASYNQRIHLYDYQLRHAAPETPGMQHAEFYRFNSNGPLRKVQVFIRTPRGERIVEYNPDSENDMEYSDNMPWFFYPHNGAYMAVLIYRSRNEDAPAYIATLKLKQHPTLNGAYWIADSIDDSIALETQTDNYVSATVNDSSYYPNSVMQSLAATPFSFPSNLMVTLGVGRIKAMSCAAKALSQGQFGQFPLYAFTSEGVWALEVSSTGTYSAKQPITRDVCINPDGITQLDSAVLFPTDRGIMLISGSQTQCISEAINSEYPFDALQLPGFDKLHTMLGHEPATDKCLPTLSFTKFLKQCRMLYDYVHQRVIVYAPSITYAYVFSLKTNQWGMMFSNIVSHLNSYPDALAMDTKNAVLNFSVPITDSVKCLYVTRPLKLEAANVLKTVASVIQRGLFRKGNVSTALYGSRDLQNWHLVWSSKDHYLQGFRGSPYKYFRIAGVATLSPDENIYGASVEFTPRQTNKPR